ncbi:MAG: hypothetical protein ACTSYL_01685 [Candidatus Thorarchaeota archaeon]
MSVGRSVGRHRRNLLKLRTALLVIAVLSPLWVMPLSAPVVSDVVVVMHDDSAVRTAVRTITVNDPHVQVVEYGSLQYALTIHRTLGRVVWVSHGSEKGILAGATVISWSKFSRFVTDTPNRDIVLACNSANIYEFVPSDDEVVGIDGLVDAGLGGLIVAYLLSPNKNVLNQVMVRIGDILSGQSVVRLLSPVTITLSVWWDFLVPHGTIDVTYNLFGIFEYVMLAIACGALGSLWDAIGVVLDCFTVSFGTVLLDWIWPVLIKPALQLLISAAFGVMTPVIQAAKSVFLGLGSLFVIQALVALSSYILTNVLVPFVKLLGWDWLEYPITVILLKWIEDALTGPVARSLAAHTRLSDEFVKSVEKIGFGLMWSIVIAGLETVIDVFCDTYASGSTYWWTGTF